MNWSMDLTLEMKLHCTGVKPVMRSNHLNAFLCLSSMSAAHWADDPCGGWVTRAMTPHNLSRFSVPSGLSSPAQWGWGSTAPRSLPALSFFPPLFMFHCVCYTRHLFFLSFFSLSATHLSGTSHWGMMRVWACCAAGPRFPFDWCSFSVSRGDERCSAAAQSQTFSWNIAAILRPSKLRLQAPAPLTLKVLGGVRGVWPASIFFPEKEIIVVLKILTKLTFCLLKSGLNNL